MKTLAGKMDERQRLLYSQGTGLKDKLSDES
jgi:hypothetical protein